jgi:hypothetical protein
MGEKQIWCGENIVKLCALLDLMAKKWLVHGGKIYYFPMLNATPIISCVAVVLIPSNKLVKLQTFDMVNIYSNFGLLNDFYFIFWKQHTQLFSLLQYLL